MITEDRTEATLESRTRDLAATLVGWPSVTGTKGEATFPHRLAELLGAHSYFQRRPEDIVLSPVPGDPLHRHSLFALVRGEGRRTVVLCGHFDVVPDDDYGDLAGLARSPDALRHALIERLRGTGAHSQAAADLASGQFIPGRGMLDMKSGLAAGLAVLEAFAAEGGIGNVLIVATPDEEDQSSGMRAAAAALPAFLRDRELDAVLAINLDAVCDNGDGSEGRFVAMGCLGKLLLSAFVVGKEAHAAYPFDGVNAVYLAAELVAEIECAPALGEVTDGELAAPPTVLGLRDGKALYNVTTPKDAWMFWNVLLHRRTAGEVIEAARRYARVAIERAAGRMSERAKATGGAATKSWAGAKVLTFAELLGQARDRQADFDAAFAREATGLANRRELDLPTRSGRLTQIVWDASGLEGPAIVLGFASMPYPKVEWPAEAAAVERAIAEAVSAVARECGTTIGRRRFYPAIADMSFVGPVDEADLGQVAANTPIWGSSIAWNLDGSATPAIPTINIGPWGRDYHHWLERAHADYAFRMLPHLVQAVVKRVLRAEGPLGADVSVHSTAAAPMTQ